MLPFKKITYIFFIFLLSRCIFHQSIFAALSFVADYDLQYAVSPTGTTIVTQNVTLTNRESNVYPKQYSITLDTQHIKNVIAYDDKGVIHPKIIQNDEKTEIYLSFNQQVIGIGNKLKFTLRYENNDIAKKLGDIWEIQIPGISDDPSISTYTVSLQTPVSFGPNAYMSPLPESGRKWTKNQLLKGGISAAYGEIQTFIADVSYEIENTKASQGMYEIAIPPDTAFQKVSISSINPNPILMYRDADGNWLAQYTLEGNSKIHVQVQLFISTFISPRSDFSTELFDLQTFLQPALYWEVNDMQIRNLAAIHKTPRDIYQFVVNTLSYDYAKEESTMQRKGAIRTLANPKSSVCTEFTDVFIAIARAAGIPAREAVGYAYTTNSKLRPANALYDILHAWPEYYDAQKNVWIPIDPTWANTTRGINFFDKLDFNHIVFAYHGTSSETPYPVGSFIENSTPQKKVSVRFAEKSPPQKQERFKTEFRFPKLVPAGYPVHGSVTVTNISSVMISEATITIQTDPSYYAVTKKVTNLPPFGVITIPATIPIENIFYQGRINVTAAINNEVAESFFDVRPIYVIIIPILFVIGGFGFFLWIIFKKH